MHGPVAGRLLLTLTLTVCFSQHLAGGEIPLAEVVESGQQGNQRPFAIASDGNDYLFVWHGDGYWEGGAARVSREGAVLDRKGIALPAGVDYAVWTGKSYLLVRNETTYPDRHHIRGLRITRDGEVGGEETIKQDAYALGCMAIGDNVVIAYSAGSLTNLAALFLNADGRIVADVPLANSYPAGWIKIAWNGTHFAGMWISGEGNRYEVKGIRFTSAGVLDPAPRVLFEGTTSSLFSLDLAVVSDGKSFAVLNRADADTFARRVSGDFTTVSPPHRLAPLSYSAPIVPIWRGSDYVLMVSRGDRIAAIHLDRDGAAAGEEVVMTTDAFDVVAASNGAEIVLAWNRVSTDCSGDIDLFGSAISAASLKPRFQARVSLALQNQQQPIVGSSGPNLLAVWQDGPGVYVRRWKTDGSELDAAPLRLAECGSPRAVIFNGTDYIVFWSLSPNGSYGIGSARISRDGPLRADSRTEFGGTFSCAASNGGATLLVWQGNGGIQASRLGNDGALLDTTTLALGDPRKMHNLSATGSEGDFLLVWAEDGPSLYFTDPCCRFTNKVRGARISTELLNRNPGGFDIANVAPYEDDPSVAWNGREWLVVWSSEGAPPSENTVRGRVVARDGALDNNPAGVAILDQATSPEIRWDGSSFVVSWLGSVADQSGAIQARLVTWLPNLGSAQTTAQPIVFGDAYVAITPIAARSIAAAYARPVADPVFGSVSRAFVKLVSVNGGARRHAVR